MELDGDLTSRSDVLQYATVANEVRKCMQMRRTREGSVTTLKTVRRDEVVKPTPISGPVIAASPVTATPASHDLASQGGPGMHPFHRRLPRFVLFHYANESRNMAVHAYPEYRILMA